MYKKSFFVTLVLMLSLLVQGCASTPSADLVFAGTSARVSSHIPEKYPELIEADQLSKVSLARLMQVAAAGYSGSVDGVSGTLGSLSTDESVMSRRLKFGDYNVIFGWLPLSAGETPEEVQQYFQQKVMENLQSTLNQYGLEVDLNSVLRFKQDYGQRMYRVYGSECGERSAPQCMLEVLLSGPLLKMPEKVSPPEFLRNGNPEQVWAVTSRTYARQAHRSMALIVAPSSTLDVSAVYAELSRRLGDMVYIYVARSPSYNVPVGTPGIVKGYHYGLNQGREFRFFRE